MSKRQSISEMLKDAIRESGLTHYKLGKLAGVAPQMIDRFVSGERDLRLVTADKLAHALKLELRKPRS